MTTEAQVEKALATMREIAADLGKAKSERVHLEQFRKSKKALLFADAPETIGEGDNSRRATVADRENYAYSHPEYIELLDALKIAVDTEETLKWRMHSCELYIEVWRSQEASNRAIDRGHR